MVSDLTLTLLTIFNTALSVSVTVYAVTQCLKKRQAQRNLEQLQKEWTLAAPVAGPSSAKSKKGKGK